MSVLYVRLSMVCVEVFLGVDDRSQVSSCLWFCAVVSLYYSSLSKKYTCKFLLNGQLGTERWQHIQ